MPSSCIGSQAVGPGEASMCVVRVGTSHFRVEATGPEASHTALDAEQSRGNICSLSFVLCVLEGSGLPQFCVMVKGEERPAPLAVCRKGEQWGRVAAWVREEPLVRGEAEPAVQLWTRGVRTASRDVQRPPARSEAVKFPSPHSDSPRRGRV